MVVLAIVVMEFVDDGGLEWWTIEVVFLMLMVGENLMDGDGDGCQR